VYARWSNTGYPGAAETFKLLGWLAPQPPTACLATFGYGHVYVIVNIKHRLGVYVGWTVKDISARFYEHALLRKRMTQFGIHYFIIIGLELVNSETNIGQHKLHQLREQYWQSKLQGLRRGYNSFRVIKKKVNNRDGQLTVRPLRAFGQRHYTLKAGHLLEYWCSKGGLLHDDFFQKFKTAKLLAYITIYAEYMAGSPGLTLRERLSHELALRRTQQHSNNKKRKLQSISCVLPYTSRIWNRFKLQKVLKNGIIKSTLPLGSVLGKRKVVVFPKYDVTSRQRICNYTVITKSTATDSDTFPCYCNTSTYSDLVDPHHKHILTCDMKLLTNGSDSVAGDFLKLGTKFRDCICYTIPAGERTRN
jgi:hypothetical protein